MIKKYGNSVQILLVIRKVLKILLNFAFSLVLVIFFTVQQHPAVVAHHFGTESALTPALHYNNVLLKPFTMLVTDVSEVFWEEIEVGVEEIKFQGHS